MTLGLHFYQQRRLPQMSMSYTWVVSVLRDDHEGGLQYSAS